MSQRLENERADVLQYLPPDTAYVSRRGKDVWMFRKQTEVGIDFEIALYFDPDEDRPGYCAQLLAPEVENAWKTVHIGHLFRDGIICFGGDSMRTRKTLREAYAKSCLWAEGMAVMIQAQRLGQPTPFPFSQNNEDRELQ